MYYAPKKHNPPHIHAFYQDSVCTIKIKDCEVMDGTMPNRQIRLIQGT